MHDAILPRLGTQWSWVICGEVSVSTLNTLFGWLATVSNASPSIRIQLIATQASSLSTWQQFEKPCLTLNFDRHLIDLEHCDSCWLIAEHECRLSFLECHTLRDLLSNNSQMVLLGEARRWWLTSGLDQQHHLAFTLEESGDWGSTPGRNQVIQKPLWQDRQVLSIADHSAFQRLLGGENVLEVAQDEHEQPTDTRELPDDLDQAISLMKHNIEEPLTCEDIAHSLAISRRQLERRFKQVLGEQPSKFYLSLRLEHGRFLLRESNYSIVQIALMCGFSSGAHFSSAYRACFQRTPSDERKAFYS
ncbi:MULTISPECIES: helix-turn-helix domain-containing protein [unclassified Vibrio]|uniref:Helix-turn-helix domain-containing protein n=1 Tax=Vibrio sp. HB236076 TaxID=3232307 RepID=A0AB39HL34_9VIBR|nr:helix-turn-helix domain-containing protein [Vibrio sp. HB161653]MDP5252672.1 helix-turn-helix domain-containing protein [Vibrio sp. HB161653]